ncbi:MAG: hypothetical protein AAB666_03410 [Patescibacteria group bacterium]
MAIQNDSIQIGDLEIIHSWEIPETLQYQRGKTWYIVMSVITLALIAFALLTANFLFALMVVLFASIIFMSHTRAPLLLKVAITDKGVLVNGRFYSYANMKSFWIIHEPPVTKDLFLDFQSSVRPPLSLHLDTQEPEEIRQTLAQFLAEDSEKKEVPLSDLIWKILKL